MWKAEKTNYLLPTSFPATARYQTEESNRLTGAARGKCLFAKSDFEATNCLEGPPFSQTVQRKDDQICDLHKTKVEVDSSHQFFSIQGHVLCMSGIGDSDGLMQVLLKLKEEDLSELGIGKAEEVTSETQHEEAFHEVNDRITGEM
eukprot:768750-Hanusia_phi.AAC.2